jgi:transcriptional regulator with XRE-family HTH domain
MKLNIGNKIAAFRRENNKTQEQLADYVGVSVAAVSKWETNQSYPDIALLPSIADFFEVSIDGLLDYKIADNEKKLKQIHESIEKASSNDDYNTVLPIVTDALKKYPNDIKLLDNAARKLTSRAWTSETKEQDFKDAIGYYERIIQCTDDKVKIFWSKKEIALIYDWLGDIDTAIEKYSEINESMIFSFEIAQLKHRKGNKKEAKQLVASRLWDTAFSLFRISSELCRYYHDDGNFDMMLESQKYHIRLLSEFINDTPNYADDLICHSYIDYAKNCKNLEKYDEMWDNIEKAVYHAARFDKNPSYKFNSMKFLEELGDGSMMATSSASLACHYILGKLKENFADFTGDERYIKFCSELESTKKTKVEAGIWE